MPYSPAASRPVVSLVVALLILMSGASGLAAQERGKASPKVPPRGAAENPFPQRLPAPELLGGTGFLNSSGPITLRDLRGKVVLLDFWTYCCINCMHILPDLRFLEEKYAKELVVVGVHSAKFENEQDTDNIRQAIQRYEIVHPVINDSRQILWQKYGINSWPSLVLIDPEGFVVGIARGEGNREVLDQAIAKLVAYHRAKGTLDETPVHFDLERDKLAPAPLRFPGKVLADEEHNRLFISDSNHNRVVISTLEGQLLDVIGSGAIGKSDGPYASASFDRPQGMTLDQETLYVADTENHLIRAVDLTKKTVSTFAGTGKQARFRESGGSLKHAALNSPWDLCIVDGVMYIAMAGPHQIWLHRFGTDHIGVYAGSGREDVINGPLGEAALAQPSGITTDGKFLYVVDSEGSAVRRLPAGGRGEVKTLVGTSELPSGQSLFAFGDQDGVGSAARLQHPLGIAYYDGTLFVADSYNHKIKQVILKNDLATTWLGNGEPGDSVDPPRLSEPGGLSVARGKLYIADTNNHRICVADIGTKKMTVLTIEGLTPPDSTAAEEPVAAETHETAVPKQTVASGDHLSIQVRFHLPEEFKLNKLAPVKYTLKADGNPKLIPADALGSRQEAEANEEAATIKVPLAQKVGKATLHLAVTYSYCRDGVGGVCKFETARWRIPVEVLAGGKNSTIELTAGD